MVSRFAVPDLGVGVGFRIPHYRHVCENQPPMGWFEVISENFMVDGGRPLHWLERLTAAYPVVLHGVSMSLGAEADVDHLRRLRALVQRVDPPWVSDHLCFNGDAHVRVHDLLPVPYTREMLDHLTDRVKAVQDVLGKPFAIENVSSYLSYHASEMSEWEFLATLAERADCALLLDVNNVYVSACNHGFDPIEYLDAIPADRVVQIHVAGHTLRPEGYRLDTHDGPVIDEVAALYRHAIRRVGPVSTLLEWDAKIPTFAALSEEAGRVAAWRAEVLGAAD